MVIPKIPPPTKRLFALKRGRRQIIVEPDLLVPGLDKTVHVEDNAVIPVVVATPIIDVKPKPHIPRRK